MLRLSRTLTRLPVGTSRLVACRPLTTVAIAQKVNNIVNDSNEKYSYIFFLNR